MRTKPLLLVLPLLWSLSGASALAAAVCTPGPAARCCCCQRAEAQSAADDADGAPMVAPTAKAPSSHCPCKVAPRPADPVIPATTASSTPDTRPDVSAALVSPSAAVIPPHAPAAASSQFFSDDSPPYLTAANPRR